MELYLERVKLVVSFVSYINWSEGSALHSIRGEESLKLQFMVLFALPIVFNTILYLIKLTRDMKSNLFTDDIETPQKLNPLWKPAYNTALQSIYPYF